MKVEKQAEPRAAHVCFFAALSGSIQSHASTSSIDRHRISSNRPSRLFLNNHFLDILCFYAAFFAAYSTYSGFEVTEYDSEYVSSREDIDLVIARVSCSYIEKYMLRYREHKRELSLIIF